MHTNNNKIFVILLIFARKVFDTIVMILGRGFLLFTFTKLSCVSYRKIYFEVYPPLKLLNSE